MDFKQVLGQNKDLVWQEIQHYLSTFATYPEFCQTPPPYQPIAAFHQSLVEDYPRRQGKYLRPTLVLLTALSMGFSLDLSVRTAAAMQVSEDWILNHDDVEDDSLFRRGLPTLHRLYSKELAYNAGDALHVLMWKMLRDNEKIIGSTKTFAIMDEFTLMLKKTILGQTVEIKWFQDNNLTLSDEDIFFILESKTGYYTIGGPMRLGAILAGATDKQLEDIYHFGRLLGRSFQIKDDLLDLTSNFGGQKDQQGNDIYEGKRTIMLSHLIRTCSKPDLVKLGSILQKDRHHKTQSEVDWVLSAMHQYGSIEYGSALVTKFASDCLALFDSNLAFLQVQPYRDQIRSAIDFIATRDH